MSAKFGPGKDLLCKNGPVFASNSDECGKSTSGMLTDTEELILVDGVRMALDGANPQTEDW